MNRTAVIVDPHPLWLEAVQGVLERLDFKVVGKATSPADALALVQTTNPDLLVAEVCGERRENRDAGLLLLEQARSHSPSLRIVVLSTDGQPESVDAAIQAGALAYVVKSVHPDDLASAIRLLFERSVYLAYSATTGGDRANGSGHNGNGNGHANANGHGTTVESPELRSLTRRELEIVRLVAEGHSNAELARMLWVTEQTVKFHLSNIYRKLGVANRTEASRWAQVHGLLPARPVPLGAA